MQPLDGKTCLNPVCRLIKTSNYNGIYNNFKYLACCSTNRKQRRFSSGMVDTEKQIRCVLANYAVFQS